MLEKDIEKKVCDYAKKQGCLVYKFTSPARAAVPDRLFISPSGRVWFCEFKREGAKPTPAQEREHARLRDQNATVYVVDNVTDGQTMVDEMVHAGFHTPLLMVIDEVPPHPDLPDWLKPRN